MSYDDRNNLNFILVVTFLRALELFEITIIACDEVSTDEHQKQVGVFQILINFIVDVLTGQYHSIVPDEEIRSTLDHFQCRLELFFKPLILMAIADKDLQFRLEKMNYDSSFIRRNLIHLNQNLKTTVDNFDIISKTTCWCVRIHFRGLLSRVFLTSAFARFPECTSDQSGAKLGRGRASSRHNEGRYLALGIWNISNPCNHCQRTFMGQVWTSDAVAYEHVIENTDT